MRGGCNLPADAPVRVRTAVEYAIRDGHIADASPAEIVKYSAGWWLRTPNFGKSSFEWLRSYVRSRGYDFFTDWELGT